MYIDSAVHCAVAPEFDFEGGEKKEELKCEFPWMATTDKDRLMGGRSYLRVTERFQWWDWKR